MPRKTASINVHHVFGTKSTVAAEVYYRGKRLWYKMENNTPSALLDQARAWAYANNFTHTKVAYG